MLMTVLKGEWPSDSLSLSETNQFPISWKTVQCTEFQFAEIRFTPVHSRLCSPLPTRSLSASQPFSTSQSVCDAQPLIAHLSQFHNLLASQLHSFTASQPHRLSQLHSPTQLFSLTASPPHSFTASLPHSAFLSLQPHSLTTSQHHNLTASQPHSLTASQLHSLTASQPHSITTSQPQYLTASQPNRRLSPSFSAWEPLKGIPNKHEARSELNCLNHRSGNLQFRNTQPGFQVQTTQVHIFFNPSSPFHEFH